MLTKEQIKNLKEGDPILTHGTFSYLHEDGDIAFSTKFTNMEGEIRTVCRFAHPSCVSLPENGIKNTEAAPKYDPCRKFRKGDIVRLREYNGRKPYDYWHKQVIKNFGAKLDTVLEDELDSGNVDIFQDAPIDELTVRVNSCHLELVTPVEKLEPYSVGESTDYFSVDDREGEELSIYWKDKHPNAKAAAEAERDRLNAEYRKEQNNG